jgi:hypothetical protein
VPPCPVTAAAAAGTRPGLGAAARAAVAAAAAAGEAAEGGRAGVQVLGLRAAPHGRPGWARAP